MNQGFVNKVLKVLLDVVLKILENIKIKKKNNTMPDNQQPTPAPAQPPVATLGANTIIQFTAKTFLATIGSILGLFVAFYFMVVVPKAKDVEAYQKELNQQQQTYVTGEFNKMNNAIQTNNSIISDLSKRFEDLNTTIENSGGGFGGNDVASIGESAVDPTLAENRHQ